MKILLAAPTTTVILLGPGLHRRVRRTTRPADLGARADAAAAGGDPRRRSPFVTRVAQQPYLRVDRNDYSIDPASPAAGSRSASASSTSPRWC
jgi:hypothetical protein